MKDEKDKLRRERLVEWGVEGVVGCGVGVVGWGGGGGGGAGGGAWKLENCAVQTQVAQAVQVNQSYFSWTEMQSSYFNPFSHHTCQPSSMPSVHNHPLSLSRSFLRYILLSTAVFLSYPLLSIFMRYFVFKYIYFNPMNSY